MTDRERFEDIYADPEEWEDDDDLEVEEDAVDANTADADELARWEEEDSPSGRTDRLLNGIPDHMLGDY